MGYEDYAMRIKQLVTSRDGPLGWQEILPAVTAMSLPQLAAYYGQLKSRK